MFWFYLYLISVGITLLVAIADMVFNGFSWKSVKWKITIIAVLFAPLTLITVAAPFIEKFYDWLDDKIG